MCGNALCEQLRKNPRFGEGYCIILNQLKKISPDSKTLASLLLLYVDGCDKYEDEVKPELEKRSTPVDRNRIQ